ncbi:hypothetical protein C8J56DRAFT_898895 [Mycena floridula]|nr:hypothetical protein C8J56DRAFT_898895 [Mycena floridula]
MEMNETRSADSGLVLYMISNGFLEPIPFTLKRYQWIYKKTKRKTNTIHEGPGLQHPVSSALKYNQGVLQDYHAIGAFDNEHEAVPSEMEWVEQNEQIVEEPERPMNSDLEIATAKGISLSMLKLNNGLNEQLGWGNRSIQTPPHTFNLDVARNNIEEKGLEPLKVNVKDRIEHAPGEISDF